MDSAQLFSFVATANCGVLCGLKIDFLDIDPDAIEKATESFKAIGDKIKTNDITFIKNSNVALQNLSSHFVNQAIFALQGSGEPNYEIAYEEFINSLNCLFITLL